MKLHANLNSNVFGMKKVLWEELEYITEIKLNLYSTEKWTASTDIMWDVETMLQKSISNYH
jgi:hypothetical protein